MLAFKRHIAKASVALITLLMAVVLLAAIVPTFLTPAQAFASGLAVEAACPADGATDVPTSGRLWVRFDHNVAAVPENANRVHLIDASGAEVSEERCTVSLPDADADFEYRQYAFLDVDGLDGGTKYTIRIDGNLAAKNGATLGADVTMSFTTVAAGEQPIALANPESVAAGSGGGGGNGAGGSNNTATGETSTIYIDATPQGGAKVTGSTTALSSSDITLSEWHIANTQGSDLRPTAQGVNLAHYAVLGFSRGVDYFPLSSGVNPSLIDANCAKVSLQRADGTPVEGARVYTLRSNREDRQGNIYIDLNEGVRLAPLSEYRIVVEPGLTTWSGGYESASRYVIIFRTDGDLGGGWSVQSAVAVVICVAAVVVGLAVGFVRRRGEVDRRG